MPDDETKVKGMITKTIGFDAVNKQVTQNVTNWVGQQLRLHIDLMLTESQPPAPEAGSWDFIYTRLHGSLKKAEFQ